MCFVFVLSRMKVFNFLAFFYGKDKEITGIVSGNVAGFLALLFIALHM